MKDTQLSRRPSMLRWLIVPAMLAIALAVACGPAAQPSAEAPAAAPDAAAPAPETKAPAPEKKAPAPEKKAPAPEVKAMEPKRGGTFTFYIRKDPPGGFESALPGGRRDARKLIAPVQQMLLTWDNAGDQPCTQVVVPYLAKSWRFVDDTTVEIKLRQGVKFHNKPPVNGRELVAEDVVWSLERAKDRGLLKKSYKAIESIEATDKYTVVIKTKGPQPLIGATFLSRYETTILPKEAADDKGNFGSSDTLIGTGPFILDKWTPGVKAVYSRNPDYFMKDRPYIDKLEMPVMRDDSTRLAALRVGKLDYLDELSVQEKAQILKTNAKMQFENCESSAPFRIYMKNSEPPFNDINVRRAMSMAIDREAIVKSIYKGEGNVIAFANFNMLGGLKPADFPPELRKYMEYNPEAAKKLLAEAGYANGLDITLESTMGYGSPYNEVLEILPFMMEKAGINAKLDPADLAQHQTTHTAGVYKDVMVTKGGCGPTILEACFNGHHSAQSKSQNRGHLNDPEFDKLIDQLLVEVNQEKRIAIMKTMQIRIVDQAYFVPTPTYFNFHAYQPWVGGFKANEKMFREGVGFLIEGIWIDK